MKLTSMALALPCLLLIWLTDLAHAEVVLQPDKGTLDTYLTFCEEKNELGKKRAESLIAEGQDVWTATYLKLFYLPQENSKTVEKYRQLLAANELPKDHLERLVALYAMYLLRYQDFKQMEELLNFSTEDRQLEASRIYRKALVQGIAGKGKVNRFYLEAEESFKLWPSLYAPAFVDLIVVTPTKPELRKRRQAYLSLLDKMDERDPYKNFLHGTLLFQGTTSDPANAKVGLEKIKQAHLQCPSDLVLKASYARVLTYNKQYAKACDLLSEITTDFKYYSPQIDYFAAVCFSQLRKKEKTKSHLAAAIAAGTYLPKWQRNYLLDLKQWVYGKPPKPHAGLQLLAGAGFAIVFIVFLLILLLFADLAIPKTQKLTEANDTRFHDKSLRLRAVGVATAALGGLGMLAAGVGLFFTLTNPTLRSGLGIFHLTLATTLALLSYSLFGFALGISLYKRQRLAQALMLAFSWIGMLLGLLALVTLVIYLPQLISTSDLACGCPASGSIGNIVGIIMTFSILCLFTLIPGLIWFLLRGQDVRATCRHYDAKPCWTDNCPITVLALACLLFNIAAWMPITSVAPPMPAFPLFGFLLSGPFAYLCPVILSLLLIYTSIRLCQLKKEAWWLGLGLGVFLIASYTVTFSQIEMSEYFRALGYLVKFCRHGNTQGFIFDNKQLVVLSGIIYLLLWLGLFAYVRKFSYPEKKEPNCSEKEKLNGISE